MDHTANAPWPPSIFVAADAALEKMYHAANNMFVYKHQCKRLHHRCEKLWEAVREMNIDRSTKPSFRIPAQMNPMTLEVTIILEHISAKFYSWSMSGKTMTPRHPLWDERLADVSASLDYMYDIIHCCVKRSDLDVKILSSDLDRDNAFNHNSALFLDGKVTEISVHPIGGGGYSDVFQGQFEGRKVAIKVIRPFSNSGGVLLDERLRKRLWREYLAWSRLAHPNVLEYLGFSDAGVRWANALPSFISPLMSNGTIPAYLEKHPNANRLELLPGIAGGLSYLHSREPAIAHGDIRGANILISDSGCPLLSDFGLSRVLAETTGLTTASQPGGSLRWMSPELFQGDTRSVSTHSDVWAYGMTVLEILSGKRPYCTVKHDTAVLGQITREEAPARPDDPIFSEVIWDICQSCWLMPPRQRPPMHKLTTSLLEYQARLKRGDSPA